MHEARLRFDGSAPDLLSVRWFRVREAIHGMWEVELRVTCADASLALDAFVGHPADFRLFVFDERRYRGVCTRMGLVRIADDASGLATYEIVLRPELWRASQRKDSRLFQHVTIPQILGALLTQHEIPHAFQLSAEHPLLELRTQYHETDLAFFCRLAEEAGISFWLDDDGASEPRVVLHDAPHAQADGRLPLAFADDTSLAAVSQQPFATKVTVTQESRPGLFTARDHDFWRPRVPLYAQAASDRPVEARHEQYEHLPGSFLAEVPRGTRAPRPTGVETKVADDLGQARFLEAQGQRRASERMEAMQAERVIVGFETNVVDLPPGRVFRVIGHPRLDVSTRSLLCLRFSLEGEVAKAESWRFACEAAFTDLPHRPAPVTPKPRIDGVHTAVVVGPPGAVAGGKPALDATQTAARLRGDEEIYVDEHGRVRVQFPWDRGGAYDGRSSMWMRVSQGWAGMGYGMFTLPRIGHEVLVAFIDGDPDSPLVVGRVHNGLLKPPHKLPENKTVSTWKSASSPGGGGFNELRFDDAAGREHVYLQAERDMDHLVKRDHKVAVGRDENRVVEGDRGAAVGGSETRFVNHNEVETTGMNRVSHVGVHRVRSVGVEDSTFVGQRWSVTIARGMARKLARKLDDLATDLGGVLRTTATGVLGALPNDPLGAVAEATLTGFGRAAYDRFKDALGVLEGLEGDEGPLPTSIQMVDRQIKLTTGEATILLDGPNITFLAGGKIAFHAADDVVITSEKEVAIASRGHAAIVSAEKDIVVQAGKNVHLNPYVPGGALSPILGRGAEPKRDPEKVLLCTLHGEGEEHPLGPGGVCTRGPTPPAAGDPGAGSAAGYQSDVPEETPLGDAERTRIVDAIRTENYLALFPKEGLSPDLDALHDLQNRLVDNVLRGRHPLAGITPLPAATGESPGFAGAMEDIESITREAPTWQNVSDARTHFAETRHLYRKGQ